MLSLAQVLTYSLNFTHFYMLKSIFPLSFLTFLSRVCGFVREVVLYRALGGTALLDAYILAFRLPNQTRRFFAEGSYNQALLPHIDQAKEEQQYDSYLTQAFVFLFSIVGLFSLSTFYKPAFWVDLVAPSLDEQKYHHVCYILRYTGFYAFFMAVSAFFGTILQVHKVLYPMALAPVITNVCVITAVLTFGTALDDSLLGYTVFCAGAMQCAYIVYMASPYRFNPFYQSKDRQVQRILKSTNLTAIALIIFKMIYERVATAPYVSEVILLWLLSFILVQAFHLVKRPHPLFKKTLINFFKLSSGGGLIFFNSLVDIRYISGYGQGAYSHWHLCERVTDLPFGVLVSSLYVIFTSHYLSMHKHPSLKVNLELKAGLFILILVVPCTLGLAALAEPIVHIFYADKSQVPDATRLLQVFSLGIIPFTLNKIYLSIAIVRSQQNLILMSHFVGSIFNFVFDWYFDYLGYGIMGVLYSTLITVIVQAIIFEYYVPFITKVLRLPLRFFTAPLFGFSILIGLCFASTAPLVYFTQFEANSFIASFTYPFIVLLTCGFIAAIYLAIVHKQLFWLSEEFKSRIQGSSQSLNPKVSVTT